MYAGVTKPWKRCGNINRAIHITELPEINVRLGYRSLPWVKYLAPKQYVLNIFKRNKSHLRYIMIR